MTISARATARMPATSAALRAARPDPALATMAGVSILAGTAFAILAVLRHRAYRSMAMDFAFFDQIVWNTAEGRWFQTSFVPYNFMGQHVEPILLLFAGLYRITPSPLWLLVVQAGSVALAATLLFSLARRRLRSAQRAALLSGAFLLSPNLHSALAFDYHSEVLSAAFVFGGMLLVHRGRVAAGAALLIGTLLLKEDAALVLLGLTLPLWWFGHRRAALVIGTVGIVWFAVVVGLYMPWVRGGPSDLDSRYAHLGAGVDGIVSGIVRDPVGAARFALGERQRIGLAGMIGSQGGLPLLAPVSLAASAPVAAVQLLSNHPPQQMLRLQYGAQVLPLVTLASLEGLRRLAGMSKPRLDTAGPVLLAIGAVAAFLLTSPFSPARFDPAVYRRPSNADAIEIAIEMVPADASVSAQSGIAAHLSQRRHIWEFPVLHGAEYVVIDAHGVVARPYQDVYGNEVSVLQERGYRLVWERDGVRVYRSERNRP
jgi:uncharacterized membrane protein